MVWFDDLGASLRPSRYSIGGAARDLSDVRDFRCSQLSGDALRRPQWRWQRFFESGLRLGWLLRSDS